MEHVKDTTQTILKQLLVKLEKTETRQNEALGITQQQIVELQLLLKK